MEQELVRENYAQEKEGKTTSTKTYSKGLKQNTFKTELRKHLVEDIFMVDIMKMEIFLS